MYLCSLYTDNVTVMLQKKILQKIMQSDTYLTNSFTDYVSQIYHNNS